MKTCFNGATTMPQTIETDIEVASHAGFDGIELWWDKVRVFLKAHDAGALKSLLAKSRLRPVAICPLTIWPFRDSEAARQSFREAVETAPKIGCDLVIVCPDFRPARLTREEALSTHAEELAGMAEFARKNGVRLAIEPIGRHTLVPGPREALDLIVRAGNPTNVGIVVDTFHYFRSQVSEAELAALPADKIFIVHVNDTEDGAIDELTDANRVYPMSGVIPLREMVGGIHRRGYDGYLSVEIFRPDYWKQPAGDVADRSMKSVKQLIAAAEA